MPTVPAFESALDLGDPNKPILVDEAALAQVNADIKESNPAALRFGNEAAHVASLFAKRAVRPDEIAGLRREMFSIVARRLKDVDDVLEGKKSWSPTQTRLFALLTERVMPKLTNITVDDPTGKKMEEMTIDELEAIALGKKKGEAIDAVLTKADVFDQMAEKQERYEAKKDVIRQLATVEAIDDAEKKYIANKVSMPIAKLREQAEKQAAKPMPQLTPEQTKRKLAAQKAAAVPYRERLIARGHTPEEADAMEMERRNKIRETKNRWHRIEKLRKARTMNLGDGTTVASDIDRMRKDTIKEFRVHGLKGVRKQTTLTKRADERKRRDAKLKEREENPRIYVNPEKFGITKEMLDGEKLRLRKLRELKPEAFGDEPNE
jgi:hypothetical protein